MRQHKEFFGETVFLDNVLRTDVTADIINKTKLAEIVQESRNNA